MHDIILGIIRKIFSLEFVGFCWVMSLFFYYHSKYPEETHLIQRYFRYVFLVGSSIVILIYTIFGLLLKTNL